MWNIFGIWSMLNRGKKQPAPPASKPQAVAALQRKNQKEASKAYAAARSRYEAAPAPDDHMTNPLHPLHQLNPIYQPHIYTAPDPSSNCAPSRYSSHDHSSSSHGCSGSSYDSGSSSSSSSSDSGSSSSSCD
jgi:hypothetical protein